MALVTCPQCKRENVSDYAFICPDCGFLIRHHFHPESQPEKHPSMHFLNANIDKWIQTDKEKRKEEDRRLRKPKLVIELLTVILTVAGLVASCLHGS